jgi:hypothetical protein
MRLYEIQPIKPKPPQTLAQARVSGIEQRIERDKVQLANERERQRQQREAERQRKQRIKSTKW